MPLLKGVSLAAFVLALAALLPTTGSLAGEPGDDTDPPAEEREPIPGKLSADRVVYHSDGTVLASGNVVFESTGLMENDTFRLTTEELRFDVNSGVLESDGAVTLELIQGGVIFSGQKLVYNTRERVGHLSDAEGSLPVERGTMLPPSRIFITDGDLTIESRDGTTRLVFHQATLTTYPFKDTDFWLRFKRLDFVAGEYVEFTKMSAYASGYRVFYWPKSKYKLTKSDSIFESFFPKLDYRREDGARVFYRPALDLGVFRTQFNLDYWTKHGLLAEFDHQFDFERYRIGVEHGHVFALDKFQDSVIYNKRYNAYAEADWSFDDSPVSGLDIRVEYGHIKQDMPELAGERFVADVDLEFKPVALSEHSFIETGIGVKHFIYDDLPVDDFTQFTSHATYGYVTPYGTDKLGVKSNPRLGTPAFRFEGPLNRLDLFAVKHVRLGERWLSVLRLDYDVEHREFDEFSLELRRLKKAYTIGISWDFSQDSASLTFGVRFW